MGISHDSRRTNVQGDTSIVQYGIGTFGSRGTAVGGTAVLMAMEKVIAKAKKFAAHLLKADESEVTFENGKFCCVARAPEKAVAEGVGGAVVESPAASLPEPHTGERSVTIQDV